MTLHEIKQMQAARRAARKQAIKTPRDALRKMHNTHDPHDINAWENNKPMWLLPLQVLGAVAIVIGLVVLTKLFLSAAYYSTLIVFSL
jgi:hypothetical protein